MAKSTILTHTRGLAQRATAPAREYAHAVRACFTVFRLWQVVLGLQNPQTFCPSQPPRVRPPKGEVRCFFDPFERKKSSRARVGYARVWNFYVYLRDVLCRRRNAQNEINLKNLNKL